MDEATEPAGAPEPGGPAVAGPPRRGGGGLEMTIFTRTFDLLTWLLPITNHFPRAHRHSFTRRFLDAAFDLRERLEEANLRRGAARRQVLSFADEALARFRLYLRLAHRWKWLTDGQYGHAAELVAEVGRLLGGWQRSPAT